MDEYYCPNCYAVLNNQFGFDPSCGAWRCTECGTQLMDDDVYEGDINKGVSWYCDNCNALLNKQSGFSDIYGTWICTNCGFSNGTTGNDIIDEETKSGSSELADLLVTATKLAFAVASNNSSKKKQCKQKELSDKLDAEKYRQLQIERENEANRIRLEIESRKKAEAKKAKNLLKRKRFKAFIFNKKRITLPVDRLDLVYRNISYVYDVFSGAAFNNIKTISVKDVYTNSEFKDGQVEQISINGSTCFRAGEMTAYDSEIIITYHEKREIVLPFSEKQLKKRNYKEIRNEFTKLGFTNLQTTQLKDLTTGWIKKDGSVERVIIADNYKFKKDSVYKYDVNIVIEYHSFKEK